MTGLEDSIREAMRSHAADAEAGQAWPPTHRTRPVRDRRPSGIVLGVCALVIGLLIVGAGVVYVVHGPPSKQKQAVTNPFGPDAVFRSYRGIQIAAPASFTGRGYDECAGPTADTIVVGALRSNSLVFCAHDGTNGHTVITFADASTADGKQLAALATQPTRVGTSSARQGVGLDKSSGQEAAVLYVPDRSVVIRGIGPDVALARTILDTATTVDVDANGCATKDPNPASVSSTPPTNDAALVSSRPTSASICLYQGGTSQGSSHLDASEAVALAAAVNELPTTTTVASGGTVIGTGGYAGGRCRDTDAHYTVAFASPSGPTDLDVVFASCGRIFVTNGIATRGLTDEFENKLLGSVPFFGDFRLPTAGR